jgi:uncharacterized protein YndB with AHSA1/START domain
MNLDQFKPLTVYTIYIVSTPDKVWQALTSAEFTRQYFFGFAIDAEPRAGGKFFLRYPDGGVHIGGEVLDWSPPRRFSCTWRVEGMKEFAGLPPSIVTYEIEQAGEAVRLTMTESHSWNIPETILAGGRAGWPAILSNLKSVLETGRTMRIDNMGPPAGMLEAVTQALAEKPWLDGGN